MNPVTRHRRPSSKSKPGDPGLAQRELVACIGLTAAAVGPHGLHLSPWLGGFFVVVLLARLALPLRKGTWARRLTLPALTLVGLALVVMYLPSLFSRDGGVALLSVMMGLKALEMESRRDLTLLCLLGYFVVTTQFLYDKGLGLVGYLGLVVWGLTTLLVHASRAGRAGPNPDDLRAAGVMLAQSLPIMVVLFVLFPRLDRPLWTLGVEEKVGVTGLSDQLRPGRVSSLVQSDQIAFRVEFEGDPPPPQERYFRGPVFWTTDGLSWSGASLGAPSADSLDLAGAIRYRVTLEPSGTRWLLALDYPLVPPSGARLSADGQMTARQPTNDRRGYVGVSVPGPPAIRLPDLQRRLGLQLPEDVSPRMRALADEWRRSSLSAEDLIGQALAYFHTEPFAYTLTPPLLGNNPTDEFLFVTRQGFCEHFATAFTLLMRLAGLPSRVVTGYQGGEINPSGGYLVVRQSDAHAWSEVWVEGSGWTRVDPTAAVAPERIERSIDPLASEKAGAIHFRVESNSVLGRLLLQVRWGVDSLALSWHYWVVGYSRQRQSRLLDSLGLGFLRGPALGIGAVLAGLSFMAVLALGAARRPRHRTESARRLYDRFCQRLAARAGLVRSPSEGPRDFAQRVGRARPDLADQVASITSVYVSLRYGRDVSADAARRLKQLVDRLEV